MAIAPREMSQAAFTAFLATTFEHLVRYSQDDPYFVCMDWRHTQEMLEVGAATYGRPKNLTVGDKGIGGMGTFDRSRHELIFVFKNGTAKYINSFAAERLKTLAMTR